MTNRSLVAKILVRNPEQVNLLIGYFQTDSCVTLFNVIFTVIENNEIVYRDYVDISVAVATPKVCK